MIYILIKSDHRGDALCIDIEKNTELIANGIMAKSIKKRSRKEIIIKNLNSHNQKEHCLSRDYPIISKELISELITITKAKKINLNNEVYGILVCGSGIGMSISSNRYRGIRAALCRTQKDAYLARAHNNCNILVLGAENTSLKKAIQIIITFVSTQLINDDRYIRRIGMIDLCCD